MRETLLLLCLVAGTALADVTVYRSVDADGTVSYSDRPPADAVSLPLRVESDPPPPSPEVAERREAMRAQADQLQAERLDREQQRALAAATAAAQEPPPEWSDSGYHGPDTVPLYYPYRPRPPWWEARPPRPPPVIPRPNPQSASPRGLLERIRQQY